MLQSAKILIFCWKSRCFGSGRTMWLFSQLFHPYVLMLQTSVKPKNGVLRSRELRKFYGFGHLDKHIPWRIRMYAIYGLPFTINIPPMLAYNIYIYIPIYHTYGSVMGMAPPPRSLPRASWRSPNEENQGHAAVDSDGRQRRSILERTGRSWMGVTDSWIMMNTYHDDQELVMKFKTILIYAYIIMIDIDYIYIMISDSELYLFISDS